MWAKQHTQIKPDKFHRGFTIVELLIVIVVIGILAAIVIVAYNGVTQRSRDAARMSSVETLKKSIEYYYADNGSYPTACGVGNDNSGCPITNLSTYLSSYIKSIPQDPLYPTRSLEYVRGPDDSSYGILIHREVSGDCKTGTNIHPGWWGVSVPAC